MLNAHRLEEVVRSASPSLRADICRQMAPRHGSGNAERGVGARLPRCPADPDVGCPGSRQPLALVGLCLGIAEQTYSILLSKGGTVHCRLACHEQGPFRTSSRTSCFRGGVLEHGREHGQTYVQEHDPRGVGHAHDDYHDFLLTIVHDVANIAPEWRSKPEERPGTFERGRNLNAGDMRPNPSGHLSACGGPMRRGGGENVERHCISVQPGVTLRNVFGSHAGHSLGSCNPAMHWCLQDDFRVRQLQTRPGLLPPASCSGLTEGSKSTAQTRPS